MSENSASTAVQADFHRQGGGIGRRARLRIAKSSISKRRFSFQKTIDLREENAIFQDQRRVHEPAIKNVVILAQFLVDEPAWAFERLPNKLPI